jgi:hypothetical protein
MYFSCLKGKLRPSPHAPHKVETLAETVGVSPGGDEAAVVSQAYEALMASTPKAAELRARFEGVIFMLDNTVRNTHVFPDFAAEEADRLATQARQAAKKAAAKAEADAKAQAEAERTAEAAAKAVKEAEAAAQAAETARAAMSTPIELKAAEVPGKGKKATS